MKSNISSFYNPENFIIVEYSGRRCTRPGPSYVVTYRFEHLTMSPAILAPLQGAFRETAEYRTEGTVAQYYRSLEEFDKCLIAYSAAENTTLNFIGELDITFARFLAFYLQNSPAVKGGQRNPTEARAIYGRIMALIRTIKDRQPELFSEDTITGSEKLSEWKKLPPNEPQVHFKGLVGQDVPRVRRIFNQECSDLMRERTEMWRQMDERRGRYSVEWPQIETKADALLFLENLLPEIIPNSHPKYRKIRRIFGCAPMAEIYSYLFPSKLSDLLPFVASLKFATLLNNQPLFDLPSHFIDQDELVEDQENDDEIPFSLKRKTWSHVVARHVPDSACYDPRELLIFLAEWTRRIRNYSITEYKDHVFLWAKPATSNSLRPRIIKSLSEPLRDFISSYNQGRSKKDKIPRFQLTKLRHSMADYIFERLGDIELLSFLLCHKDFKTAWNSYLSRRARNKYHRLIADIVGDMIVTIFKEESVHNSDASVEDNSPLAPLIKLHRHLWSRVDTVILADWEYRGRLAKISKKLSDLRSSTEDKIWQEYYEPYQTAVGAVIQIIDEKNPRAAAMADERSDLIPDI